MMDKSSTNLFGNLDGLDDKSCKSLTDALLRNNLKGFDYLEFRASLRALSNLNMDNTQIFQSAFATASVIGLTKEHLVTSAEHYKNVLQKEKNSFDLALQNQVQQHVIAKKNEISQLEQQLALNKQKIAELEAGILQNEALINQKMEQIKDADAKINATKEHFEQALQAIHQEINHDIESINLYL
jgi:chromosome segregation ATPase